FWGYGFALVLIMLRLPKVKLSSQQVFLVLMLLTYVVSMLIVAEHSDVILKNFRFYYGFIIFILFFKVCVDPRMTSPAFFYLVCATVILETVLINTIIDPFSLMNYPDELLSPNARTAFFGFYQRPYSFAGNPSMSVAVLIALYCLVERSNPGKL